MTSCNRHSDCDLANERVAARYREREELRQKARADGLPYWQIPPPLFRERAEHCHDEGCQECFGY